MADAVTATWNPPDPARVEPTGEPVLILLANLHAPWRTGEVAFLPQGNERHVLGRHGSLRWIRHRPGVREPTGPLADPRLSREQVAFTWNGSEHVAENLGRMPLSLNGQRVRECPLRTGDRLQLGDRVLLLVTVRPRTLPGSLDRDHDFGGPDPLGWVGESQVAWDLRERVRFVGKRNAHVLVLGQSGAGKELVARGVHARSDRAGQALVSRNAATIPESLADAELFGNLANYPNPGMPARPGLVGEADQSTLFLDEFAELPEPLQARLLRVLDDGEYSRLGEARPRRADLRLIAATNRDPASIKHDVLARLQLRIDVPGLHERGEDVPLLAIHLLRRIARDDEELRERFFEPSERRGSWPRLSARLVAALVAHPYATHVRELESLLWHSIGAATGDTLDVPPDGLTTTRSEAVARGAQGVDPAELDPEAIQVVLDRHGGRQEPTWRELGLASRHVLARLVKKHGLKVRGRN